ncbi:DNA polymerase III subunit gamma and tau [Actinoplanes siamensis]|uniref:DNA polymerase III subunit gamma/tau n=1 Tax=Actinoplanes siamensis TaxID=1223317 RepID=A0A919NAT4_9ACTN|nr:DNA polymerase III subunit gamma and tau [Actinoplanes siamensis]GIF07707.1 hypothetical protein Asi03nite_52450 [Actinoplanes siamensis]
MALALYRKYRPRTFAEVIGQEHVTEPLSQALRTGRLNHAYLFSGPRGCGKTSSARILARSLNCEQGPTPEPCGVCASCKSLANDGAGSIDVIEIDAASHGGVDDARELREKAFFAPANSRYKIYVIDEAHMVSSAGFNALLKLVEEPPEYVKFIFATTEPDKVLGTIRSRTHHYPFRLIPPAVLRPYLQQLTEAEGIPVEPAVFPLVVRAGGGSARDTLSVLDQLIAGAGPQGVSYSRAVALLGVTDAALIDEMCDALADGDGAAAYQTIDRVAEAGHDPRRYASDLLERLRDLIVLQQVPDAVAKGLIDGAADQLDAMREQAARLGAATLSRCADIVHNGLVEMRGTTAPRLLLELITARMLLPGADDSAGALLQRLERLERRGPIDSPEVRGEAAAPSAAAPVTVPGGVVPAVAEGAGAGKAAARAAALAASRRTNGGPVRPVSPAPAEASPEPVLSPAPAAVPVVSAAADAAPSAAPDAVAAPEPVSIPEPIPPVVGGAPASPGAAVPPAVAAEPASGSVSPAPVTAAGGTAPGESDWNRIADGAGHYDDEPPWDGDPPEDREPPAAPRPRADDRPQRIRAVWQAFGPKHPKIQAMQDSGIGIRSIDGDTVVFAAPSPRYAERFLTYTDVITTEFGREVGGRWQIRCEIGEAAAAAPDAGPRGSATREQAPSAGRDQPAGPRGAAPSARAASSSAPSSSAPASSAPASSAPSSSAPERNTGRTESRPSRTQRPPASDADDDWPAPAGPPPDDSLPPEPDDDPYVSAPPHRPGPPTGGRGGGIARPAASEGGDTGWPEPVRPGAAAPRSAPPPADDDWPEPVKPGTRAPARAAEPRPIAVSSAAGPASARASEPPADPAPATNPDVPAGAGTRGGSASGSGPAPSGSAAASGSLVSDPAPASGVPGTGAAGLGAPAPGAAGLGALATSAPAAGVPASGAPGTGTPVRGAPSPSAAAAVPAAGGPALGARPAAPGAPARSAAMEAARAAAARGGNASPSSGLAAARAAAANARNATASRAANQAAAQAPGGRADSAAFSDGTPIGEAPYDPDYDGPPPAGGGFDGFDPGDEPLDEVIDEKTARQSSEEQAFQLLRDAFGAERIGEM